MKRIEIIVNGKAYPCSPTMGAMLRFKEETGREITEIVSNSLSDLCTYLWCCVASASKRDGVEFNLSLMEFADNISAQDMTKWQEEITKNAESTPDSNDEKKRL